MGRQRIGRFLSVGLSAAGVQFLLAWALMWAGFRPALGALTAFAVAFLYAYSLHRRWTFVSDQRHAVLLPRYALAQACCALAGALAAEIAQMAWGWPVQSLALASVLVSGAMAYVMSLYWVFR